VKDRIYSIEMRSRAAGTVTVYRFRSLFNNAIGCWCEHEKDAIEEGEQHQRIISNLFARSHYSSIRIKVLEKINKMIDEGGFSDESLIRLLSALKP